MSTEVGLIRGARTTSGETDLSIRRGRIVSGADGPGPDPDHAVLDADGAVVAPAFVDAHVHLDKAHLLESMGETGPSEGLTGALKAVAQLRAADLGDVFVRGARAGVRSLIRHGVAAVRAHVEIGTDTGLSMMELHHRLREEFAGSLRIQLSAFPQNGLTAGVEDLMVQALRDGAEVVGGCPYVDQDQHRHLDVVFALAERFGRPVDLHLDFDDDPEGSMVAAVAERTRALGMQGQVTIGHVTKLAVADTRRQRDDLALMAEAGISLVVMPATDLYLCGAGEPGIRSLAPLERAADAGVRVAVSNNNLHNPFSPYGNGNLLQAAWAAGLARQLASSAQLGMLLEAVTTNPAAILGLEEHGTAEGQVADLVLLDTDDPRHLVLQTPAVVASLRAGRVVHRTTAPRIRPLAGSLV